MNSVNFWFNVNTASQHLQTMPTASSKIYDRVGYSKTLSDYVMQLMSGGSTTAGIKTDFGGTRLDRRTQIVIPFQSLLLQMTKHLHFPAPKYKLIDVRTNSAAVLVYTDSGPEAYTYAAQIAVRDLMERFNVWVEDISIFKRREFERCAGLYKLKRQELRNHSRGVVGLPLLEKLGRGAPIGSVPVIVDYNGILQLIICKCHIQCTGLEIVAHGRSKYTAWTTISSLKGSNDSKTFFSVRCDHIEDSKNSLAKTVIDYLIPIYNLEIIDANYNPKLTAYAAILCALEMESYLAAKERFLGMEIMTATPISLPVKICSPPKDLGIKLPTMIFIPVPPKKKPYKTASMQLSVETKMQSGHRKIFRVPEELPTILFLIIQRQWAWVDLNECVKFFHSPKYQRLGIPAATIGQPLPRAPLQLPLVQQCNKCRAYKIGFETKNFCCGDGAIELPQKEYPVELARLVHCQYRRCNTFSKIYHHVPNLVPSDGRPKYLKLYFYDGQHEAENRANCFSELRQDVIDILMRVTQTNPYARFFRSLKDISVDENTEIVINKNPRADPNVYNAPTSDEVAVIWSESSSSSLSDGPHISVTGKVNGTHRIMHYYGCYDPLQYPLLFPSGECGWRQGLKKRKQNPQIQTANAQPMLHPASVESVEALLEAEENRTTRMHTEDEKQISCREYYCYKLQNRPGNMMLKAGRCLQQYIVDMYVKVENTRLDFFRHNQDTIRAELYQGILDTIDAGESCAANVGRRVILPPTYIGGPRDLKKRYLNAMSLVQEYGKPDLFVTMTCNTNWPEIRQQLSPGEEPQNRPDIVVRVFHAKLLALKKQIMEKHVFGEVAAFIYVVEFQKRGLLHAHILIILKPPYKVNVVGDFDKFVSAEIPSSSHPTLRAMVLKHMMHGPCGRLDPDRQCMKHKSSIGQCKYKYPKSFTSETTTNSDGYPVYRRRDTGHDKIPFNVVREKDPKPIDEIEQYQSGRWVSPCEAMWRIYGFDLFETQPPVMVLPVHLQNMQSLQLHPEENLERVVANEKRARTPLTEFFKENSKPHAEQLLYRDFTKKYRWDKGEKKWFKRRTKLVVIGRLVFVTPSEGERYFLRLLLLHVRGPKSFKDLLNVNGFECKTFQEAALRRHLIEEDNTADLCLSEACKVQMPSVLRYLFATLLIFCQPRDPASLWTKYYSELSQDFRHKYPHEPNKVNHLTASSVEGSLEAMGKSLKYFNLEHLVEAQDDEIRRTKDIIDALDAPIPQECIDFCSMLNAEQKEAFNTIVNHVKEGKPGAFFIDGPGGTGKTFLYNALYAEVRLMGKIVLPTATSGIAAANIPSGRTTHSILKLPLDTSTSLSCDVPKQSSLAALIRESSLIIWDEASMAKKQNIDAVDLLLRDLCNAKITFGGKIIVFGGDFCQVLPVIPHKSQREAVEASLVNSPLWPGFIKFRLTENMRAREDPIYSAFLLSLGNGELQTEENQYVQLPEEIVRHPTDGGPDPINEITSVAFPELDLIEFSSDIFTTRAILTPMNEDVDAINSVLIDKFPGEPVIYKSYDTVLDDKCNIYPAEFVNKLCPGGMSPHELILKENCPVILLRNILPSFGLCNGTRLLCKRFSPNLIECVITTGHHKGEHVFIPRVKLRPSESANYPFQFQRNQFPIKLSFAMTINKSQGQTLSQVAVYLPRPCFSHGQLYVALSRARTSKQVTVVSTTRPNFIPDIYVKNVVSYTVLRLANIIS
ncbi:uncharacterized protein LOC141620425 [Silene latifolia]|uniref:uncharacterized protein LOC141620425 n=1 Tax=Silene latifolia TaxID=37657 RepID=UPI003D76BDA5